MTINEIQFLLWFLAGLLAMLSFIGILSVNALIKMGKDINEIKKELVKVNIMHEGLEHRVHKLEKKIF